VHPAANFGYNEVRDLTTTTTGEGEMGSSPITPQARSPISPRRDGAPADERLRAGSDAGGQHTARQRRPLGSTRQA